MENLYSTDVHIFRAINEGVHSPILDPIGLVLSYSGLGISLTIGILLLVISPKTRYLVLPMLVELFVAGVLMAQGIKSILPRDRPSNMIGVFREEPFLDSSFPSGHSSVSMGCAVMLLLLTWGTPLAKWGRLALVWAVLVGLSRIYRGVHWPTDVCAGFMVGISSACAIFLIYRLIESRISLGSSSAGS